MINPDGAVSPCCHVYHPSTDLGNIQENSFRTIWNNQAYCRLRAILGKKIGGSGLVCGECLKPYLESKNKEVVDLVNESLTNKLCLLK